MVTITKYRVKTRCKYIVPRRYTSVTYLQIVIDGKEVFNDMIVARFPNAKALIKKAQEKFGFTDYQLGKPYTYYRSY